MLGTQLGVLATGLAVILHCEMWLTHVVHKACSNFMNIQCIMCLCCLCWSVSVTGGIIFELLQLFLGRAFLLMC